MWFKRFENGNPTGNLIREDNIVFALPDVDFSKNPPPAFLESKGYCVVVKTDPPTCGPYENVIEDDATRNDDGSWQQTWKIKKMAAKEKRQTLNSKLNEVTVHQKNMINAYLDVLKDNNLSDDERKKIQDIIDQLNGMDLSDPFNVVWPKIF